MPRQCLAGPLYLIDPLYSTSTPIGGSNPLTDLLGEAATVVDDALITVAARRVVVAINPPRLFL